MACVKGRYKAHVAQPAVPRVITPTARVLILSDLFDRSYGFLGVLFGVNYRCRQHAVPQDGFRDFNAELSAKARPCIVAKLVRVPVWDAGCFTRSADRVSIRAGSISLARLTFSLTLTI